MPVFDPNAVEYDENSSFKPVPQGIYYACILSAEETPTKDGAGTYLDMQLEINDGPQQGRKLFHKITITNKSETAVSIGRQQLKKICETNNHGPLNEWADLCMMNVYCKVGHRPYNGEPQAVIKYFMDEGDATKRQGAAQQQVRRNIIHSTPPATPAAGIPDDEPPF